MTDSKIVLITGAASGIGLQAAKQFLAAGASVIAADINTAGLNECAEKLGNKYVPLTLDVSVEAEIEQAYHFIKEKFGRLDALINNAAYASLHDPLQASGQQFDKEMSINLKAPMLLVRNMTPLLRMSKNASVVNICSVAAIAQAPGHYLYSAAKAALHKYTLDCAAAVRGVRHNCIFPGVIDTPMLSGYGEQAEIVKNGAIANTPVNRLGTAEDIANAIEFLCSENASFVNGASLCVDGGLIAATNSAGGHYA